MSQNTKNQEKLILPRLALSPFKRKSFDEKSHNNQLVSTRLATLQRTNIQKNRGQLKLKTMLQSYEILRMSMQNQTKRQDYHIKKLQKMINKQVQKITNKEEQYHITIKQAGVLWKPPHRYKTAMVFDKNIVFLVGGLGCQQNISWGIINMSNKKYIQPNNKSLNVAQQANRRKKSIVKVLKKAPNFNVFPLYSHTMQLFKTQLYVYGGVRVDSITNDLFIINLQNMQITKGSYAPFRRKQHASTILGRFMIIQGGIQNDNSVKNDFFYYDCESDKWFSPLYGFHMPHLSHHGMVGTNLTNKLKKKEASFNELTYQTIYIFGGKNISNEPTNKLFKLKIKEDSQVLVEQIEPVNNGPQARFSMCFSMIDSNYLFVYGGKKTEQQTNNINLYQGIFKDMFIFNLDKRMWIVPIIEGDIELGYRFGMSSSSGGKSGLMIFGGCQESTYADGNFINIKFREAQEEEVYSKRSRWEIF